jgi:hypothetical protein
MFTRSDNERSEAEEAVRNFFRPASALLHTYPGP